MEEVSRAGIWGRGFPQGGWVVAAGRWLRRLASTPAEGEAPLRLESRVTLGPKKSLVLVNCCGKRVLLAVSADTVVPVMEIPAVRRRPAGGTAQ